MKGGWNSAWQQQAARINALTLRERVFLFLSLMAGFVALADVVWLSPAQVAHKQLTQRFEKQNAELQRAREALKSVAKPVDTSGAVRAELAAVTSRLDAVNLAIGGVLPMATEGAPLAQAMVHLLRRHEGLTLLRTAALAPEAAASPAAPAVASGAAAPPPGLTRQGVALTVAGPYPELIRYLQALEQALPQARWGVMTLKSDKQPAELTLQLFLVGLQP